MKATLKTEPMPQLRTKIRVINGKVISFTPDKSRESMAIIAALLEKHEFTPFPKHTPLKLTITFYRTQSNWSKKRLKDKYPVRRPDLSNFLKLVEDATNRLLYYDDSQIVKVIASKKWSNRKKGYITFELKEEK